MAQLKFNTSAHLVNTEKIFDLVTTNDRFQIEPLQGKKRDIDLNRCRYIFVPSNNYTLSQNDMQICLPSMKEEYLYELVLDQEKNGYSLKCISGGPFLLNGSYTYHALISNHDQIRIGYNILKFSKATAKESDDYSEGVEISEKVKQSTVSLLILGETGTGKSYLAKKIHNESGRSGEFIHINISSFGSGVLESELFGHVKGAFTGAVCDKKGAICEADGGTLFIDEIDSLPIEIQTKLLLFLDSKEIRPVGGWNVKKVNVRVIFAAGRPLEQLVEDGKFRKDFYYRIKSGIDIKLKPLREEPQKIGEICKDEANNLAVVISPDLIDYYKSCAWPGNIRQLKAHLQKKMLLSKSWKLIIDEIDNDLQACVKSLEISEEGILTLEDMKSNYIDMVWKKLGRDNVKSAQILDITPNTLRTTIRKIYPAIIDSK